MKNKHDTGISADPVKTETPHDPVTGEILTETKTPVFEDSAAAATQELATVEPKNLIAPGGGLMASTMAADRLDMAQYAGAGLEKVTARDSLIPRITILQALSDQIKKTHSSYLPGAEIGDICDVSIGEIFERPLWVLPIIWDKVWIEWYPRNTGKGIAAIHPTEDIMKETQPDQRGRPLLKNGNLVAETAQWYCLNLSGQRRRCFIPFTSTQLRKSRRWVSLAQGEELWSEKLQKLYSPPLFYRTYYLDTALERNNEGEWSGWKIERGPSLPELPHSDFIMGKALEFRDAVIAGIVKGDLTNMTDDPTAMEGQVINGRAERNSSGGLSAAEEAARFGGTADTDTRTTI